MKLPTLLAATLLVSVATPSIAAEASERKFLREGMHEGEVLLKIGQPDHETLTHNERGKPAEKTWTYFPDSKDPQTMTIIRFRSGVIISVERKISR